MTRAVLLAAVLAAAAAGEPMLLSTVALDICCDMSMAIP
jgi:hypothetical protein